MINREFVMLAKVYDPIKHRIGGWFVSTKYDGQRCIWDGGASRGVPKEEVPWANLAKDERYVDRQIATGLWSRYGNVIHAPDWFLDGLPTGVLLDGELWSGRGNFQQTRKIVSTLMAGDGWKKITFVTFERPAPCMLFENGRINNPQFQKIIILDDCLNFLRGKVDNYSVMQFKHTILDLPLHGTQVQLPENETLAREILDEMLYQETSEGGEGLMLRSSNSFYGSVRSKYLLKVTKLKLDVGQVRGYTWGREGKLCGLMGTVIVRWEGELFGISGFADSERAMHTGENKGGYDAAFRIGKKHPDKIVEYPCHNPRYPVGSEIRFAYKGLTDDGIPRDARYARS